LDWKNVCFDTRHIPIILDLIENIDFQSCHASRHKTRAGFESAPLVSVEKGSSSIIRYGPPLNSFHVIRNLPLRVTPIFANKNHALNTLKMGPLLRNNVIP
jgi:hypothetical protein